MASMRMLRNTEWRQYLPHILVVGWLLFIGVTVWDHCSRSGMPPVNDSWSYLEKGVNFWRSIELGQLFNPFNVVQVTRPPGTILLSAPLGVPVDIRWFYFRSVYAPIVCVVCAVYLTAWRPKTWSENWAIAATAMIFSCLPMFYHFEIHDGLGHPTHFGMVDNFQAGIAAIATAAMIRSLIKNSLRWLSVGAGAAAFTILIKPSGIAVMALLGMTWITAAVLRWLRERDWSGELVGQRRYVVYGILLIEAIYLPILAACLNSDYLSANTFALAERVLAFHREIHSLSLSQIYPLLHVSAGAPILIWITVVVLTIAFYHRRLKTSHIPVREMYVFLFSTMVIWLTGIYYWLVVQAGGMDIRFFYPFFLMGLMYTIPLSIHIWYRIEWSRLILGVTALVAVVNIGIIMTRSDPSDEWQSASGVDVSIGTNRATEIQAKDFLKAIRREKEDTNVYSFGEGAAAAIFASVGMHAELINPTASNFITRNQLDWTNGFVTRIDDVLSSEYLLLETIKEGEEKSVTIQDQYVATFDEEKMAFRTWLTGLREEDGVTIVSEVETRLLRINDPVMFERNLTKFVSERTWRERFVRANPQRWWRDSDIDRYTSANEIVVRDLRFDDLYQMYLVSYTHSEKIIKCELWWKELLHHPENKMRQIFIHFNDSKGKIRTQSAISLFDYTPVSPTNLWRYSTIEFDQSTDPEASAVGFGIWHPNGDLLKADKGIRDWGDRRVTIPFDVDISKVK